MTSPVPTALYVTGGEAGIEDLARAFWSLSSIEQAEFFEAVVRVAREDYDAHMQLPEHRRGMRLPPDWQWMQMAKDATQEQRDAIREVTQNVWLTVMRRAWEIESQYLELLIKRMPQ